MCPFLSHLYLPLLALAAGCQTTLIVYVGPDAEPDSKPKATDAGQDTDARPSGDAGPPRELAMGQLQPQSITLSPTTVYWANAGQLNDAGVAVLNTGSIAAVPRGGGALLTHPGLDEPLVVQYGEGFGGVPTLVWSAAGPSTFAGTISELVLSTGTLSVAATAQRFPLGVALDTSRLYWASDNSSGVTIQSQFLSGSAPTTLGSTVQNDGAGCLAIHGQSLFFTTAVTMGVGGTLYELPITGGTPNARWATTTGFPYGVAVDANNVYWAVEETAGGSIYQMPADVSEGGPPPSPTPLANGLTSAFFVAVDAKNVYFATNIASGSVYEVPIGGGKAVELASGLPYPGAVAADDVDDFVYFTTLTSIEAVRKR